MSAPRTFRLLTQKFKVEFPAELHVDNGDGEIDGVIGACDREANRIGVLASLAPDRARETYLHEVLHAVAGMAGLTQTYGFDKEEDIVKRMAPILLSALRENPRLVEYLLDRRIGGAGSATWWEKNK